ncbi:MAG: hypothetical protein IPK42_15175 [Betaproteobacteria bacterium]|nr:hypothetical protein [Betaproteobacteria bacterium]
MRQAFGDRVFDRLRERALWLAFKGKSLRQSLAAEELADLRARIESEEDDDEHHHHPDHLKGRP